MKRKIHETARIDWINRDTGLLQLIVKIPPGIGIISNANKVIAHVKGRATTEPQDILSARQLAEMASDLIQRVDVC